MSASPRQDAGATLRFCHVTTFYPPHNFGGDGIGLQRLAQGLARAGHDVTVAYDPGPYEFLAGRAPPPAPDDPLVEIVHLRTPAPKLSALIDHQLGRPWTHRHALQRLLRSRRFDVINYHNVSLVGGPGVYRTGDAVKLHMAHDHWLVCPSHVLWRYEREPCDRRECLRCVLHHRRPPQLWRRTGLLSAAAREVDAFIAMSEFSRAKHREFGFTRDMEVLPYFLPDPPANAAPAAPRGDEPSPHPRPYFLFVGRLERIKGVETVLPFFRRYPDADLLIAGDGTHRAELESLAGGSASVRFLGRVDQEALATLYRHAIALVVPSTGFETFGIILIESFRNHTPVIARRLGPFPEIVERAGGGELFENEDQLAAAVRRLQQDPGRREQLADSGYRAYREHWSESAVIPRYLDLVRRAAARRGRHDVVARLDAGGAGATGVAHAN